MLFSSYKKLKLQKKMMVVSTGSNIQLINQ